MRTRSIHLPVVSARRSLTGVVLVCLALAGSGCGAARWVGLGSPGDSSAPARVAATEPGSPKSKRSAKPERNERKRDNRAKEEARPSDPLSEAKRYSAEQPEEPWWPYRVGVLEAEAGRRDASEAALRGALARDPAYAPALAALSRQLYAQGRHEDAVALLSPVREGAAVLGANERSALVAGLALHEAALGRDGQALATMSSLGNDGRDAARSVAGYLAVRGTSSKAALDATEEAVRAAPKSAANHNNRGIALLRAADPDAAQKSFERAIELDPSLPGPYYNLAILERFYRLDTAAATKRFQQYWSRSQADPDSLFGELGRGRAPTAEEGSAR